MNPPGADNETVATGREAPAALYVRWAGRVERGWGPLQSAARRPRAAEQRTGADGADDEGDLPKKKATPKSVPSRSSKKPSRPTAATPRTGLNMTNPEKRMLALRA
jgi:hypothetical protein